MAVPVLTPVSYTHLDVYKRQVLDTQQAAGKLEINHQAYRIHNGGNQGRGHDCRVQMKDLGNDGQCAANGLGNHHSGQKA